MRGETDLPYVDAVRTAREQGWTTRSAYLREYWRVPGLPGWPPKAYPDDWAGWGAFLGRGKQRTFLPYAEARAAVHREGWHTRRAYLAGYTQVSGLPSEPDVIYAADWTGWPEYLAPPFLPYGEASAAAQAHGWRTQAAYRAAYHAVPRLPSNPNKVYAEWTTWGDFLGTGRTRRKNVPKPDPVPARVWAPYADLKARVQAASLQSARAYAAWQRTQPDLPSTPSSVYPEWEDWPTVLARTGRPSPYLPYAQASAAARAAGITTPRQYTGGAYKAVPGLPSSPYKVYPEWQGWTAFLHPEGTTDSDPEGP